MGLQVDEGQPRGVASSGRTQAAIPNAGTIATVPADVLHSRSPHLAGVPSLLNGGGASFSGTATTLDGVVAMPSTSAFAPALVAPVVGLAGGTLGEAAGVPYSSDVVQGQQSWVQQRVSRSASGGLPGDQGSGTGPPDRAEPRTDGLLPGVDTTVEGFETSLLPTVRTSSLQPSGLECFTFGSPICSTFIPDPNCFLMFHIHHIQRVSKMFHIHSVALSSWILGLRLVWVYCVFVRLFGSVCFLDSERLIRCYGHIRTFVVMATGF